MAPQLFDRLKRLRQRIRRTLWLYGTGWFVAVLLSSICVAAFIDWFCHFDDGGARFVLDLLIIGATGYVGWRWLLVPLLTSLSDVDLALRIEQRYPGLNDSLSSTVQFLLDEQNSKLGSPAMQREVIRRTLEQLNRVSLDGMLEIHPLRKVGVMAGVACALVLTVAGLNHAKAATALKRLAFPFSNIPWPRKFELRFVTEDLEPLTTADNPSLTVVQGATLDVYVENTRGPLPSDLTFEALRSDGKKAFERMRQTSLWDAKGRAREIGGASLLVSKGPIVMRAKGGDGETLSVQIDVVPPPRVDSLKLKVIPPSYTRQPERVLPENVGNIEGYVGTKVELSGVSNKELLAASAVRKDADSTELKISSDHRELRGDFVLSRPGSYAWWLALRDRQGFENPDTQRFDLRVLPDLAPDVRIDEPATDLTVTPTAQVRFKVAAKDDLGLKHIDLVHARPPTVDDKAASTDVVRNELFAGEERPQQHIVEHVLELAPLQLLPGQKVVVHAEAKDYCDIGEVHLGKSNSRTLTLVSPEEKRSELADRQAALLLELERVQKLEQTARGHVKELQLQVEQAGSLRPEDLDLLKRVELDQRQIGSRIGNEQEGVTAQTRALRRERELNAVHDPQAEQLLGKLADELDFLRTEAFPKIEQDLTQALKLNAGEPPSKGVGDDQRHDRTQQSLDRTGKQQDQVLETLSKSLKELGAWRDERNLAGDLRELSGDQQKLATDTKQLGQSTISKSTAELTPQQKAELNKLADRQQQLANRVDEFQKNLSTPPAADEDPASEQRATREALQQKIDQEKLNTQMREASKELSGNKIAQAVQKQEQLLESLKKLQSLVNDDDVTDSETLVKQLAETQSELGQLREQQESLMRKVDAAGQQPTSEREESLAQLRKEEEQLRRRSEEMLRRLQRLGSHSARRATQRAAGHMQQAEEALAQNNPEQAEEEIKETLDDLEQAERELNRDKKRAELELAQEIMERIADELVALTDRQQATIDEAKRVKSEFEVSGKWSRGLLKSARALGQAQRNLSDETLNKAKDVKSVEVLSLALTGAARLMESAAQKLELDQPDLGPETLQFQDRAHQRLVDLLAALNDKEKPKPGEKDSQNQKPNEQENSGPPGESIPIIAQLKVIRSMQIDLNERTLRIRTSRPESGNVSEAQAAELELIAEEQSRLADLVRQLTEFFGDVPEQ